jgi:hypothetical protein
VLPALDLPRLAVDLALGQRHGAVAAGVADRVHVVVDADHGDAVAIDLESACGALRELRERRQDV